MTLRSKAFHVCIAIIIAVAFVLISGYSRKSGGGCGFKPCFRPEASGLTIRHPGDHVRPDPKDEKTASVRFPLYDEPASGGLTRATVPDFRELVHEFESEGALAQIKLTVFDENGNPVPSARVKMTFATPGGDGRRSEKTGMTDSNGIFLGENESCWDVAWRVEKDGYHACWSNLCLRPYVSVQGRKAGKWFRSPFPVTAVLREKYRPHEMVVYDGILHLPENGDAVGFDLAAGSPVQPSGQGTVPDVEFSALHEAEKWKRVDKSERISQVRIAFPGKGNGGILIPKDDYCALDTPRDAPDCGYEPELLSTTRFADGKYSEREMIPSNVYILFRIRSAEDRNGVVTNGYYGKMKGDWYVNGPRRQLWFRVWINAVPGDRNLEDDGRIKYR